MEETTPIVIDPEFAKLIPPAAPDERATLEQSIKADGCRDALVVWAGKNILLDGHNRFEICSRLTIPFQTRTLEIKSRDRAKLWIEEHQAGRRNLGDDSKAMIWDSIRERRSKLAVAEKLERARSIKAGKLSMSDNVSEIEKPRHDTRAEVAREAKLPERKLRAAAEVKKASPELAQRVRDGEMPLAAARREIKRAAIVEKLDSIEAKHAKEIAGTYDVIVIDPPWPMEKIERDEYPNQSEFEYPVMSLDAIEHSVGTQLSQHTAQDCHVFVWTTQKFLPAAIRLIEKWSLKYVLTFVWHKPGGFQPFGLPQYNCEFALYARRGAPQFVDTKAFPTCFCAPRIGHSAKPPEFYDILRRATGGRRLDMFNRRAIDGFDGWGQQA